MILRKACRYGYTRDEKSWKTACIRKRCADDIKALAKSGADALLIGTAYGSTEAGRINIRV